MNVIGPIAILLLCQLAGETASRALELPVPGPVIGLVLLVAILLARPVVAEFVSPVARPILANLSLLFVPAGVGVVGNIDVLSEHWLAFALILVTSTVVAMLVSVGTFLLASRMARTADE